MDEMTMLFSEARQRLEPRDYNDFENEVWQRAFDKLNPEHKRIIRNKMNELSDELKGVGEASAMVLLMRMSQFGIYSRKDIDGVGWHKRNQKPDVDKKIEFIVKKTYEVLIGTWNGATIRTPDRYHRWETVLYWRYWEE